MNVKRLFLAAAAFLLIAASTSEGYFLRCTTSVPLFSSVESGGPAYQYYLKDRLYFCFNFLFQPKKTELEDQSEPVPIMGGRNAFRTWIGAKHPPYNSDPPTSGWNYSLRTQQFGEWLTVSRKTFAQEAASEVAVAKLYDGFVWIAYSPTGVSLRALNELEKIANSTPLVFITGYKLSDADVALAALGRLDKFKLANGELSDEDVDRIWDFILRYRGRRR
ncbi:MAG: DUF3105 domain-containing protein [Parcubacteria group bacterium]|nr:DUF3105 domain-containing protein [Parcubacteria group bacterium]